MTGIESLAPDTDERLPAPLSPETLNTLDREILKSRCAEAYRERYPDVGEGPFIVDIRHPESSVFQDVEAIFDKFLTLMTDPATCAEANKSSQGYNSFYIERFLKDVSSGEYIPRESPHLFGDPEDETHTLTSGEAYEAYIPLINILFDQASLLSREPSSSVEGWRSFFAKYI